MSLNEKNRVEYFCKPTFGEDLQVAAFGYNDFATTKAFKLWRKGDTVALHLVLGGKGTLVVEDKKYSVEKNQVFYTPKNMLLRYYPDENDPWEYIWFECKGDTVDALLRKVGLTAQSPVKTMGSLYRIENQLAEQVQILSNGSVDYLSVLGLLYQLLGLMSDGTAGLVVDETYSLVFKIKNRIELYYVDPDFTVSLLCEMLHVSEPYAERVFKRETHTTIKNYIVQRRLSAAKTLLREDGCSVKKVAERCGFGDYTHFIKIFKKATGVTAVQYRNQTQYSKFEEIGRS